ncbi:MAG: enoyl-CoA hydratase/isomerase family protein [Planctomycetaceae bacterium]|nr:enoyl-CoA hydratase/isomerase family protein [Phycisphaerales bacterium]MCE2653549.1 enoyl-CoA hydratase/isomerase family protein [Planctomycetaceae bacterium]
MSELATLQINGTVARLTLNRPEQRNALSPDLLAALHSQIDLLRQKAVASEINVCVLTGAGRSFCAGMDLKAVLGNDALVEELLLSLAMFTHKLRTLPCITLAVANGAAIGGGCGLLTVCDMSITHADSKMGFPEVDLGVCPAVVAPWLVKKIGAGAARNMLLSGGLMSGHEAHARGIVCDVAPTLEEMHTQVNAMVERLAGASPAALKATKGLLNELDDSINEAVLRKAAALSAAVINSPATQGMLRKKMGM